MAGKVLENAAMAVVTAFGLYLLVSMANKQWGMRMLAQRLQALQDELEHAKKNRAADRAGRTRAEQKLRQVQLQISALQLDKQQAASQASEVSGAAEGGATSGTGNAVIVARTSAAGAPAPLVYPFKPIGHLHTCFNTRNGTPRQPLLVPAARAVLQLAPGVPPACLEGLEQCSHCWILYVFHHNTDMGKVLPLGEKQAVFKAKIRVPRLNGGKMGVLSTRSPHRPVPIGLSMASVLEVKAGRLVLGGADIVDGSPVLDIKPYVPFCDRVPDALAPPWVQVEAEEEPLHVDEVIISDAAAQSLRHSWHKRVKSHSLYPTADAFLELVQQVLSRDIRSLHQRTHSQQLQQQGSSSQTQHAMACTTGIIPSAQADALDADSGQQAASTSMEAAEAATSCGRYRVVLDGIEVTYNVDEAGRVVLVGADSTAWSWATVGNRRSSNC